MISLHLLEISPGGDDQVALKPSQIRDILKLAQGLALRKRISALLLQAPQSVKSLAVELEQTEPNIRPTLNRNKGMFTKTPTGLWKNLA